MKPHKRKILVRMVRYTLAALGFCARVYAQQEVDPTWYHPWGHIERLPHSVRGKAVDHKRAENPGTARPYARLWLTDQRNRQEMIRSLNGLRSSHSEALTRKRSNQSG